jgi:hypothetical protein
MNNKKKTSKFDDYADIKKHSTAESFGGLDYHTIADIMCEIGDPMEHSTARNAFLSAMRQFANEIGKAHGDRIDSNKICLDPAFQELVGELIESIEYK